MIFISTVFAREVKTGVSFIPVLFWTYKTIKNGGWLAKQLTVEIIANVFMMIPIGYLCSGLFEKKKILCTLLFGLSISLTIELLQLALHRGWCELDDVFHNTFGTLLGYGLYLITKLFCSHINSKTKGTRNKKYRL